MHKHIRSRYPDSKVAVAARAHPQPDPRQKAALRIALKALVFVAFAAAAALLASCGQLPGEGSGNPPGTNPGNPGDPGNPGTYKCLFKPDEVDREVEKRFGSDNTSASASLTRDEKELVGNWMGKDGNTVSRTWLQLRADGTYVYQWWLGLGKYHNVDRVHRYTGKWHLQKDNSQLVLELADAEYPLIFSARFPELTSPQGAQMCAGRAVNVGYRMRYDPDSDVIEPAGPSAAVKKILNRKVFDGGPDYFTVVAAKANSPDFWGDIKPKGYNYGHKIYKPFLQSDVDNWEYAKKRAKGDPKNYIIVISDESWVNLMGARWHFTRDAMLPGKLNSLFSYWKAEMQMLAKAGGPVIVIFAGDAPPYWAGAINKNFHNDANQVPAKVLESRFPEALELNPPNSFAGVFQVLDYIRMKYAPNVKLGYTLKTWGVQGFSFSEPSGGWDNSPGVKAMADYLNSFGVQFDVLAFNFNPKEKSDRTDDEYKAGTKYYAAISRKMKTRDGSKPKVWIWKVSLWSAHPSFYFRNVDFLVRDGNVIGMTLGHGNDLANKKGFEDFTRKNGKKSLINTWMHEYFQHKKIGNGPHATPGPVYWR